MKLLITGAYGQLGNEMRVALERYPHLESIFTDVDTLNITDKNAIDAFVSLHKPNILINCAAYTAVDKAEDDVELCYKINSDAVRNLGEVAQVHGMKVIHISTDYVFDGTSHIPYTEDMPVSPTNVYGKSKLAGERELQKACPSAVIIRTSWLYSGFGNNFVKTMLKLGRERTELKVIFDQIGTPTYAADLASAILQIVDSGNVVAGVYHFSNEGVCSWYDFTKMIFKLANINCEVFPIESKDYVVRTPRPHYSVLNKSKLKLNYNQTVPYWIDGLERCLKILLSE
ncbi:MAG TPA: dTDP-4-dehydrorhamnose reductase [Paludibacteraceae bacterium]|jgi:dTDP-4-dehydrorhamnose reductase|nr:dTDP-4-dehydrorhamnose reductase [Paludibacteraceae bacterium]HRS67773.1 dTDP-4-dehydrorhamnose reductase [Paludibacteraceae bacterium]